MENRNITIEAYNKNAEKYTNKFMEFEDYKKRVNEFVMYIKAKDKILDLGCGPGNVIKEIKKSINIVNYIGVDLSEEMLKIAQKINPEEKFICKDLKKIEFEQCEFDIIIMSFCIVHLEDEDMEKLLKKVSNYTKKNGKLYISFMEGKTKGYETTSFSKEEIFFNYYQTERIERELLKNGYKILKISKQEYKESDGSITKDIFIFAEKSE